MLDWKKTMVSYSVEEKVVTRSAVLATATPGAGLRLWERQRFAMPAMHIGDPVLVPGSTRYAYRAEQFTYTDLQACMDAALSATDATTVVMPVEPDEATPDEPAITTP